MPLTEEYIKELFASDAFKEGVRQYIKDNLRVKVTVNNGADYSQRSDCVNVDVELSLDDDVDPNSRNSWRSSYFASGSDSTSVDCSNNNNGW
jgi:hypothetical protein